MHTGVRRVVLTSISFFTVSAAWLRPDPLQSSVCNLLLYSIAAWCRKGWLWLPPVTFPHCQPALAGPGYPPPVPINRAGLPGTRALGRTSSIRSCASSQYSTLSTMVHATAWCMIDLEDCVCVLGPGDPGFIIGTR